MMRALAQLAGLAMSQMSVQPPLAHAAEPPSVGQSLGQRVYVPIYSSATYLEGLRLNLAVTVGIRNTDSAHGIAIEEIHTSALTAHRTATRSERSACWRPWPPRSSPSHSR